MTKLHKLSVALLAAVGLATAASADSPVTVSADLTAASSYVWRGMDILGNPDIPLQPSVTVAHSSGFSLNAWGSFALKNRDVNKYSDEIDLTLDYSRDINEQIGVSAGAIAYLLPTTADGAPSANTMELYAGVSANVILNPSVTFYYDTKFIDDSDAESDSYYIALGLGHTLPITGDLGLDIGVNGGYAKDNGFDAGVSLSSSLPVGPVFLTPFVAFTYAEDDINVDNTEFFGGLTVSWSME